MIARDPDAAAIFMLADQVAAQVREVRAFDRELTREALRPVSRAPRAKAAPVDRSLTAEFVDDDDAILFFAGVRARLRAGKPVA